MPSIRILRLISGLLLLLISANECLAGPTAQIHCSGTIAAWKSDTSLRSYMSTHSCSCPNGNRSSPVCVPIGGKSALGMPLPASPGNFQAMVAGAMFQSLLTAVFADNSDSHEQALAAQKMAAEIAWKKAEEKKAEEAKAQAEYDKMMTAYKQLEGAGEIAFKTLSSADLGFKGLDDSLDSLAAGSRQPFDTPGAFDQPEPSARTAGTAFFGDTMPIEDIRFLVNPENDPRVVDLTKAREFVVGSLKKDSKKLRDAVSNQKPGNDCKKISAKLSDLVAQRDRFHKTVELAHSELSTWQTANRNALMNAAKDGIDYFIGRALEHLTRKGEAADRLMVILNSKSAQMTKDGVDVAAVAAKINRLKLLSDAGSLADYTANVTDWSAFIKHGISAMIVELSKSSREVTQMLDDPSMQAYFETEAPALKALLDISTIAASNKVFGKWVSKQVPIIAAVELGINQLYNGLDFYLSYKRIAEAHRINGQVLSTARSIQSNIDKTLADLADCR